MLRSGRATEDRGAAAVEFALVAVLVLIPLLLGIMEFGRAFNAQLTLQHAVREGARVYAITRDSAQGVSAASAASTTLNPSASFTATPNGNCTTGNPATINGEYTFTFIAPLIGTIVGSNTLDLNATGVMRCGG